MIQHSKAIALFLATGFLLTGTMPLKAQQRKGLKKGPNVSLNITNPKKDPPRTYFNLGLFSNFAQLNGVGINAISSIVHHNVHGIQVSGLANVTGLNASGLQISGLANVTGKNLNGAALSGLMNVSGKNLKGLQISALGNISGENMTGLSISGLINLGGQQINGLQLAGLANISGKSQKGMAIGGLMNATGESSSGIQLTSLLNVAGKQNKGLQLAALGNVSVCNKGMQLGMINFGTENKGLQIGLSNICHTGKKGLQIGLVNISKDSTAHQIGCINIRPTTRIQMLISGGNDNKFSLGVRFKNRYTYTIWGIGAYSLGMDRKLSLSGFYRAGLYYPILPKLEISGDIGFQHIETMDNKNEGYPARMYALQPRINLEYSLTRHLGFFASGGYNWTRTYQGNHLYGHKGTFEAGIVLF